MGDVGGSRSCCDRVFEPWRWSTVSQTHCLLDSLGELNEIRGETTYGWSYSLDLGSSKGPCVKGVVLAPQHHGEVVQGRPSWGLGPVEDGSQRILDDGTENLAF